MSFIASLHCRTANFFVFSGPLEDGLYHLLSYSLFGLVFEQYLWTVPLPVLHVRECEQESL